jgi:hypothetical protein
VPRAAPRRRPNIVGGPRRGGQLVFEHGLDGATDAAAQLGSKTLTELTNGCEAVLLFRVA